MADNLESALSLLLIGMITVFVVLLLVVIVGNVLISIINRFFTPKTAPSLLDPKKLAAITAAVDVVTEGKGKIEKIEKL